MYKSDEDAAEAAVLVDGPALAVLDATVWVVLHFQPGNVEELFDDLFDRTVQDELFFRPGLHGGALLRGEL